MNAAAPALRRVPETETRVTTLLALVEALGESTDDDREVVEAVLHLLRSGQVRLCGNFRNASVEDFE